MSLSGFSVWAVPWAPGAWASQSRTTLGVAGDPPFSGSADEASRARSSIAPIPVIAAATCHVLAMCELLPVSEITAIDPNCPIWPTLHGVPLRAHAVSVRATRGRVTALYRSCTTVEARWLSYG